MLPEIFDLIGKNLTTVFNGKKGLKKIKFVPGGDGSAWEERLIRIELLRFGQKQEARNYVGQSPSDKSFYAFTFFIVAKTSDYNESLLYTEIISDFFDRKPFIQMTIGQKEYEVAISALELTLEQLNQFWMAQRKPHHPVLFYQARISDI